MVYNPNHSSFAHPCRALAHQFTANPVVQQGFPPPAHTTRSFCSGILVPRAMCYGCADSSLGFLVGRRLAELRQCPCAAGRLSSLLVIQRRVRCQPQSVQFRQSGIKVYRARGCIFALLVITKKLRWRAACSVKLFDYGSIVVVGR